MRDDKVAWPLLTDGLLGAVTAELQRRELPEVCWTGILPGALVALDYCGSGSCGGMLWARVNTIFPSTNFPQPDNELGVTGIRLRAVELEIGLVRKGPVVKEVANRIKLPTMEEQLAATRIQMGDMAAIDTAICKYLKSIDRDYVLGAYTPLGPDGECLGGTWFVTVAPDL